MNVLILEDEQRNFNRLRRQLEEIDTTFHVEGPLANIQESVEWLRTHPTPDLILADIRLSDGLSFDILRQTAIPSPIIFTTAYDEYAIQAFKYNSFDYLLKPIKESDLRRAVEKLEHLTRAGMGEYSRRIGELVRSQRGAQAFLVYVKDRIIPLKTEDIAYLYSSNEKVAVCTLKGEHFPFDRTLDAVMAQLPEEGFFRANRQFVISREAIADISVWFGNRLSVNLSVEVPEKVVISKARVPEFKRWISGIR